MKICRFDDHRLGLVEGDEVIDVSAALDALPAQSWPYPPGDALIANLGAVRIRIGEVAASGARHPVAGVRLMSPVADPTMIIGIARNRRNLEQEAIDPGLTLDGSRGDGDCIRMFIKANSALVGPSQGVELRFTDRRNDPEAEFTIVMGRTGTDISEADALDYVAGYCIGMDMTLRGPESASSRKSIDSYAVLGPWLVTADEIPDPDNIATSLSINGKGLQDSNTRDLAFGIRSLIARASSFYTLYPGDVIMAGTPMGFEPVTAGDVMVAEFERIGRMEVAVRVHRN